MQRGIAVSPGIALGTAFVIQKRTREWAGVKTENPHTERLRLLDALEAAKRQIRSLATVAADKAGPESGQIFETHLLLLQDPKFIDDVLARIENETFVAEDAIRAALAETVRCLEQADNPYLRERVADLKDVEARLLAIFSQGEHNVSVLTDDLSFRERGEASVAVAESFLPSEIIRLHGNASGLVAARGGENSHAAILARALGMTMVSGIGNAADRIKTGDFLIVDGNSGLVSVNPENELICNYQRKLSHDPPRHGSPQRDRGNPSLTADGHRMMLFGNINRPDELDGLWEVGADGVGLLRTEFLFTNRRDLPSEAEQVAIYRDILQKSDGMPVVFRTLDIGGDKPVTYFPVVDEPNPALGYRGLRIFLDRTDLFTAQLRAILSVSGEGNPQIMVPMIGSLGEWRRVKEIAARVRNQFLCEGVSIKEKVPLGILIEVPSAAILSDHFAREVDFISIGTNDLIQFVLAADRTNEKVADYYDPFHPAVLRLIKWVADNADRVGIPVGVCGEMAGDSQAIPLLVALGISRLSMNPDRIPAAKQILSSVEREKLRRIAGEILNADTSEEVQAILNAGRKRSSNHKDKER